MTENEAIERLEYYLYTITDIIDNTCKEDISIETLEEKDAYEMAISALKEIQQYREIGTVEDCREAVEKQKTKKCVIDSCPDHTHYECPSCGKIQLSIYKKGFPRLGRITKYCDNFGQALGESEEE